MKKTLFLLVMFLTVSSYASTYKFTRPTTPDAGELAKEIESSTGLKFIGKDQEGYISTKGGEVEINIGRDLTQSEKDSIQGIVTSHDPEKGQKDREKKRKDALKKFQDLGITQGDLDALFGR